LARRISAPVQDFGWKSQTSGKPRVEVEREMKFKLAVRLFEAGQLSLGKAAELAGWNRIRFPDLALAYGRNPGEGLDSN
jgi:hypothetical protein